MSNIVIGIDLGTTYSAVAYFDEKAGEPKILENKLGKPITPSVVGIKRNGQLLVGQQAKAQAIADPENTVGEIKRMMGEAVGDPPKPYTVRFNGADATPPEISAYILRYLKDSAEERLGGGVKIDRAVITCPAYFSENKRQATIQAGRIAGLHVMRIINEPTAAAIAYGLAKADIAEKEKDEEWGDEGGDKQRVLIYDLGGGTFDVSIIEILGRNVKVIATEGDARLGGADFDEAVTKWVLKKIQEEYGLDFSNDRTVRQRIRNDAEQVKINLSAQESETISLPNLCVDPAKGTISPQIELSRAEFEMLIMPYLKKSIDKVNAALESKNLKATDLTAFLLVGGSTRIPAVRRIIKSQLGVEPRTDLHPDLCVAQGAAIVAYGYRDTPVAGQTAQGAVAGAAEPAAGGAATVGIHDVTGHSLGTNPLDAETHRPVFDALIPKDTPIPASASQIYTNPQNNQVKVVIGIFQGENMSPAENEHQGDIELPLPPLPAGQAQIKVTFNLDVNGTLNVDAQDLLTGTTVKASYQYKGVASMNDDEFKKAQARLNALVRGQGGGAAPTPSGPAIPADYKAFWDKAKAMLPGLPPDKRQAVQNAMDAFLKAVQSGDRKAIEDRGNDLSNVVFSVME